LDGIDDGGAIADRDRRRRARNDEAAQKHVADDIVWPRPALAEDLRVRERELARQNQEQMLRGIAWRRKGALENVKHVEELSRLYGRPRLKMTNEPTYAGRPLKQLLAKGNSVGHPDPTLEELLTLQQIKTGQEPEVVTFELPIQHDVTTNLGTLLLLIDPETPRAVRTWEHKGAEQPELHRVIKGTNGNCRIEWSTIFVPPGKHFVMTELAVEGVRSRFNEDEWYVVHGPMVPFEITNVCYFDIVSATYDPTNGGPFYGFTAEPNARYQVELKSPAGKRVCGFKGETTNGVIDLRWDAKYEDGKLYGGGWVDTFWDIELTGSGRHQKLKGP
jgi:hypothetical protein